MRSNMRILNRILLIFLTLIISIPSGTENIFSFAGGGTVVMKTFEQMTEDEKERALRYLIDVEKTVPNTVKVDGKTYSLNLTLWRTKGLIVYGNTSAVNALVQVTNSPNYKDGQWRYWGFDMNGGLYGNDDFPPDVSGGTSPQNKNWLTTTEIRDNSTASDYVGSFAMSANSRFSSADKWATATAFLSRNPAWRRVGLDENYIIGHFYYNCVLSDSGLTRGQFVGVHKSAFDGNYYYQTFEVKGGTVKFVIPDPKEDPLPPPDPEEPVIPPPEPEPEHDISVNCALGLPAVTYTGHPALAEDRSVFLVDGEAYSARRTYEEGLASNGFSTTYSSGSVRRISKTQAEVKFSQPGKFQVELAVTPKGGIKKTDTKSIEVKKTPTILHTLTGTQKQNRKQVLNLQIAKNPESTLTDFWVKLDRLDTEESVTLHHKLGAEANSLSNSETIKTRPIERLSTSDMYFENCRLEFLLKNDVAADCRYTVYVKDSRGNTDQVSVDFSVASDKPPEAEVLLESYYVRKPNSNNAQIIVEDGTKTDGDQVERAWYYREKDGTDWVSAVSMPGYTDHSVGTGKKISFLKEGVGTFQIKLDVKDLWTEETLKEYVTEDERKTGSVTASAEVINVSPVVSLSRLSSKTADITILTGGEEEFNLVKENQALITQTLLQHGVDADIVVEKMCPAASQAGGQAATKLMETNTPFGYNGGWTFYEDQNFLVDEERLFKIDATWPGAEADSYPESPYTISCWQAKTGSLLWTYTFTDQLMTVSNRQNGSVFTQDDSGRYLFFSSDGKTLMLTKDNGSFITVLNMEIGDNVFSEGDSVYTLKEDGIYSISLQSGQTKKVYRGNIAKGAARRLEGKIHFLTLEGMTLFRCIFDPTTEKVRLERIVDNPANDGLVSYKLLGIDVSGNIIINAITSYKNTIMVYGRDNRLSFTTFMTNSNYTATPVYDAGGNCNYLAYTWETRSGSGSSRRYYTQVKVMGIYNGYSQTNNVYDSNGSPSIASNVIFARELSGKVHVCTGAYWTWILNTNSYGNGPAHGYPERTKVFTFDPVAGTAMMGNVNDLGLGLVTREYGVFSDTLAAVQTGNNNPGLSYGNETVVVTWEQTLSKILNRYMNKYFSGYKDINALVVYDETNSEGQYTSALLHSLENKLGNKNGKLIITNREDLEGKGLGESILALSDEEKNVLGVEVEEGTFGTLTKTYDLEPDTTYYYEYDLKQADGSNKDALEISLNVQTASENQSVPEGYKVTEVHFEDFNDQYTDPIFRLEESRMKEGIYSGAHPYRSQGKNWTNRFVWEDSSMAFIVPPGKKAVLSFDWQVYMDGTQAWMANYIKINDKLWNTFIPESGNGHYTHSELLPEGENTLYFYAGAYGGSITEAKMWIDNLRVEIVDPQPSVPDSEVNCKQTSVSEPISDGYTRVEGSFHTPPLVGCYSLMENAEVVSGPIGEASYTAWDRVDEGRKQASFVIPEGKTAIYTLLSTRSRPNYYNDRNYACQYKWGTYRWQCNLRNKYPENALYNCPADYIITLPYMTGPQTFNQDSPTYRGAYGDFINIDSVLVDSNDSQMGNPEFFMANSSSGLECYKEDCLYQKQGNIIFHLPQGNHALRNLKIYSIRKGVKVYAGDETFADSSKLQEWETDRARTAIVCEGVTQDEHESLVYKKNQLVAYNINYFDYEGDPSKKEYWRYTHTPYNDGPHPEAAVVLDGDNNAVSITDKVLHAAIKRFTIDGKYTVEHWQEDNTGNPDYDRLSNVEPLTFYIEGGASAPWVESIRTIPGKVKEGDNYSLEIKVNDLEKDILRLVTEVYSDKKLVYAHRKNGITADDNGIYPTVLVPVPQSARVGSYEVVCTVRDDSGAGFGSYRFIVTSSGKICGSVYHTDDWDDNRKKYNLFYFKQEFNQPISYPDYLAMRVPRKRGTNVFWSGERFLLSAYVAGNPEKVTVHIPGSTEQTSLVNTGRKNPDGESIYQGSLWNSSMLHRWGRKKPEEVDFRFTAYYSGDNAKIYDTKIILDSGTDYWLLHRLW